jgi:hypothetical protein
VIANADVWRRRGRFDVGRVLVLNAPRLELGLCLGATSLELSDAFVERLRRLNLMGLIRLVPGAYTLSILSSR